MAQKVVELGIARKKGYLYYVDSKGDVSCAKMARGRSRGGSSKKVAKCNITRKHGYLYFVDKNGDVSCAKMKRGGKKKKRKK